MNEEQMFLEIAKKVLEPTALLNFIAILISLATSYLPKFREWYAKLETVEKAFGQMIMITIVIFIAGIMSFTGFLMIVPATKFGALILLLAWFSALATNQTTYRFTKTVPAASVKAINDGYNEDCP